MSPRSRPAPEGEFDVAVIGGGIAGLTTALLLKRDGARVAVIEAARVGSGVTGVHHGEGERPAVDDLLEDPQPPRRGRRGGLRRGEPGRRRAGRRRSPREEGIDCDLERRPAFTYAADESERAPRSRRRPRRRRRPGCPRELVDGRRPALSPSHGAVRLDDQLAAPPRPLRPRARRGGRRRRLRTSSRAPRALGVDEGTPCRVRTTGGDGHRRPRRRRDPLPAPRPRPVLRAPGAAALLLHRRARAAARRRAGMSISAGSPTRSVRSYGDLLIVGGEGHPTGARDGDARALRARSRRSRASTGTSRDVTHRWSAQDPVALRPPAGDRPLRARAPRGCSSPPAS